MLGGNFLLGFCPMACFVTTKTELCVSVYSVYKNIRMEINEAKAARCVVHTKALPLPVEKATTWLCETETQRTDTLVAKWNHKKCTVIHRYINILISYPIFCIEYSKLSKIWRVLKSSMKINRHYFIMWFLDNNFIGHQDYCL